MAKAFVEDGTHHVFTFTRSIIGQIHKCIIVTFYLIVEWHIADIDLVLQTAIQIGRLLEMNRHVCTLKTTILQIHDVPADETVGYSRKGHLTRPSRIAAIPIGYADGLNRHLGNGHCYCLVNGKKAPYVGNICMDVCMIDVTDIDCKEGDKVEIFGDNLPVTVLSDTLDTIPYEVLTSVSNRVKRIYFQD